MLHLVDVCTGARHADGRLSGLWDRHCLEEDKPGSWPRWFYSKLYRNKTENISSWKVYFTGKGRIRILRVCVIASALKKDQNMWISPCPRLHRGYQCRLRGRGGLRNRNRIDARSQNFIDRTEESDVGGGSLNVVQSILVILLNPEDMARHRGLGSCGESTHMCQDNYITLRCMN
jgi:hypothetical protein